MHILRSDLLTNKRGKKKTKAEIMKWSIHILRISHLKAWSLSELQLPFVLPVY